MAAILWLCLVCGNAQQPFTYNNNAQAGLGLIVPTAANGWFSWLTQVTNVFLAGDHVYVLLQVNNISDDHIFEVEVAREGSSLYTYPFGTNLLQGVTRARSYCWGELDKAAPGNYAIKFWITCKGKRELLDTVPFTVIVTPDWKPFSYTPGSTYAGHGPIQGGETNGWVLSLTQSTNVFLTGDHPYILLCVNNISDDHLFEVEVLKEGNSLYGYPFGNNLLQGVTRARSYCWGELANASPGNYAIKFWMTLKGRRELLDTVPFTVIEKPVPVVVSPEPVVPVVVTPEPVVVPEIKPFVYDSNACVVGYGPITGGETTDGLVLNLAEVTNVFQAGDHIYGLISVSNITVYHMFQVGTLKDSQLVSWQSFTTNQIQRNGNVRSYCFGELMNATPGNWEYQFWITYNAKTEVLDTVPFTVLEKTEKPFGYDDNGYTGYGPVRGKATIAGWLVGLPKTTNVFKAGDHVYGLLYVDNLACQVSEVDILKDDQPVYRHFYGINQVRGGFGDRLYFWEELANATPGNWAFRFWTTSNSQPVVIDTIPFTVLR